MQKQVARYGEHGCSQQILYAHISVRAERIKLYTASDIAIHKKASSNHLAIIMIKRFACARQC